MMTVYIALIISSNVQKKAKEPPVFRIRGKMTSSNTTSLSNTTRLKYHSFFLLFSFRLFTCFPSLAHIDKSIIVTGKDQTDSRWLPDDGPVAGDRIRDDERCSFSEGQNSPLTHLCLSLLITLIKIMDSMAIPFDNKLCSPSLYVCSCHTGCWWKECAFQCLQHRRHHSFHTEQQSSSTRTGYYWVSQIPSSTQFWKAK